MSAPQLAVGVAQVMCDDWRNMTASEKGTAIDGIKGFLIPPDAVADLISDNVNAIRVYLAMDGNGKPKLVVVGTEDDNGVERDIIGISPDTKVYNFTVPCPSDCDQNSPLF